MSERNFTPDEVKEMMSDQMDAVVSIVSAMLWDFHERAVEKYGPLIAAGVNPDDPSLQGPDPETCEHRFVQGTCVYCKTNEFLGGS